MSLPQSYGWIPISRIAGSLASTLEPLYNGIERNLNAVQASLRQIIAYLGGIDTQIGQLSSSKAPLSRPAFTGYLGLPTVTEDPGDPPVGKSWTFVIVDTGVSVNLITRNNDAGTIREIVQPLS